MGFLTAVRMQRTAPRGATKSFVVADGIVIYAGALVGLNAAGYLDRWVDQAGHTFLGVALQTVTGATSAAQPPEAIVDVSGVTLRDVPIAGTFVQADVNSIIHCASDNAADAKKAANTNTKGIGWASRFASAGVGDITLFTPEEYLGLN